MTGKTEATSSRASIGMVIFIVAMVTMAAVGQLFIKDGVNNFETVLTLREFHGAIFVPEQALVQNTDVDAVKAIDSDGGKFFTIFEAKGKYKEGILTNTFNPGDKIVVRGKFPSDFAGFLRLVFYWPVFIGLAIYFFFGFAWLKILGSVPVSFAFPFLALGYIVIILGSAWILGEEINAMRIGAIILIIAGVICLSRSDTSEHAER